MNICYINGNYKYLNDASVNVYDRGFTFGDGAYEAMSTFQGRIIDFKRHYERLIKSLNKIHLHFPYTIKSLQIIIKELLRRNNVSKKNVAIYLQVTRGVSERNHNVSHDIEPTLFISLLNIKPSGLYELPNSINLKSHYNIRWYHCDIKSISLLGNILPRINLEKDYQEVVFYDQHNHVTECSSSNIFFVDDNNVINTYPLDNFILAGITRQRIKDIAIAHNIGFCERKFTIDEMLDAKEIFISSSVKLIAPVAKIDKKIISSDLTVTKKIFNLYCQWVENEEEELLC